MSKIKKILITINLWRCIITFHFVNCGHGIMAITSAFQADDAGSIPAARSRIKKSILFEKLISYVWIS